ncbi:hypothetical protein FE257_007533 [Aspergillus nanangensis]|uniref:Nuclear pore assembly and biogenesis-domain-containing protein n=1 Tax=Aspergillus nanangensis TaxID=2582783 RepID=A0AAD4CME6_ASPNN|nr:hypothetical protein FE257_007533 [Aspergillus nanangensis]
MDFLPESLTSIIQENPTFQHLAASSATAHLLTLRSTYLDPYIEHLRTAYLDPYIIHPLATMLASSMPNLVSVLVLVLVLVLSIKILDYGRRLVMFWVSLVLRLLWWAVVIGLAWYVYTAGWEKTGRDLGWFYGVFKGFVDSFQDGIEGAEGFVIKNSSS